MGDPSLPAASRGVLRSFGPALIVASVVLGPGSILSSSRVGAAYGASMCWVVVVAAALMAGMVAIGARLGVVFAGTPCDELAARLGRPLAALVGLTIFLICAGFQFGNNLGVLAALDSLLATARSTSSAGQPAAGVWSWQNAVLVVLNGVIVLFLYRSRRLYAPIETLMKLLVGVMIVAFVGNFLFLLVAAPAVMDRPSSGAATSDAPTADIVAVLGLVATTFSIAGAFYQAYLVREKGWGVGQLRQGFVDAVAGIAVLGSITVVILLTAALSFHGRGVELTSATDVAQQLEPLFGSAAVLLFGLGIFAASFSSFLVNAMIGGAMLADGLGWGGTLDGRWTKNFTVLALLCGMAVAIFVPPSDRVGLVVFAQAMVVIGFPLLALSMLFLATRPELTGARAFPTWMKTVGVIGLVAVLASAVRSGAVLAGKLFG